MVRLLRESLNIFDGEDELFGDMSPGKSLGQFLVLWFMESRLAKLLYRDYSQVLIGKRRVLPNPLGLI